MEKENKGITLIALVVTIIVLLILAGISIMMLAGQNGILNRATEAKEQTGNKNAEEKVKMAVMGALSQSNSGTLEIEKLINEVENYGGETKNSEFPLNVTMDGKNFTIEATGIVKTGSNTLTNGTLGTVTGKEEENTIVEDSLGNQVVVPAGFKVINPTDNVTDGIVIEDVSYGATEGSQFVWIPVGEVIKDKKGNTETITLGRYVFNSDGTINTELSKKEPGDQLKTYSSSSYYYIEGLRDGNTENTHAKDIEDFKNKVINTTHGYYIGRYEARDKEATEERTKSSSQTNQVICTDDNYVYNYITQAKAAELSRGMYSNSNFESDLVNSYAWGTAVYFLQTFDNRASKEIPYSRQFCLNGDLASKGTNSLDLERSQDKICNVWDMASNCRELTTETNSDSRSSLRFQGRIFLL